MKILVDICWRQTRHLLRAIWNFSDFPQKNRENKVDKLIAIPSLMTAVSGLLALIAGVIWWLIRIRQNRVWLPTVRILRLESPQLPKLRMISPPIIPFLCFIIAAGTLLFFTLRPKEQIYTPFEPEQTKIHLFFDMSPSTAKKLSLSAYAKLAKDLWTSLGRKGRITVSTSHSPDILEPKDETEIETLVMSSGFHRAGLRIGSALTLQLEKVGNVDRLFVVSDRDQHSWNDFNWRYLLDEMEVAWVPVRSDTDNGEMNFYINKAHFLSLPSAMTMDWEVDIERSGQRPETKGVLKVMYREDSLASVPWTMPAGLTKATVSISWPVTKMQNYDPSSKDPLVWALDGIEDDQIPADNEFRTAVKGIGQQVIFIGESAGERILDDASHQLEVSLEILGFRIRRFDRLEQPGPKSSEYPFWVIVGGDGSGISDYCPVNIAAERLSRLEKTSTVTSQMPKIWLVPRDLNANYSDLCWCYHRMLKAESATASLPMFCKDVTDRDSYIRVLTSLGANQIGGELGHEEQALAFSGADKSSGLQILAFTLPLKPSRVTGIDHAKLPILVKDILAWQKMLDVADDTNSWPRLTDNTKVGWTVPASDEDRKGVMMSNVPYGESTQELIAFDAMPPKWTTQVALAQKQLPMKKDREDPTPWLLFCGILMLVAMAVEILWFSGSALVKFLLRRKELTTLFLVAIAMMPDGARADISLSSLGFQGPKMSFAAMSSEVSQRTSLVFSKEPETWATPNDELLGQPWIWAASAAAISDANGVLLDDIGHWLKRGGILFIEGPMTHESLAKLTSVSFRSKGESEGWIAIPPDHVLMRSFYLLDSLPSCNSEVWTGFHYDDRLAILSIPLQFLEKVADGHSASSCNAQMTKEILTRTFVNVLMMSLSTDYKKDQIHLPEILKRLR
jgi:hypothetical protein